MGTGQYARNGCGIVFLGKGGKKEGGTKINQQEKPPQFMHEGEGEATFGLSHKKRRGEVSEESKCTRDIVWGGETVAK